MKRLISLLAGATIAMMIMTPRAHASLLLEPYLGYYTGSVTCCSPSLSRNQNGVAYGARVGYENLGFMIGLDAMTGNWSVASGGGQDSGSTTPTDLGIFVGYNFPVMVRIYGEYGFSAQNKYTIDGYSTTDKGTNIKLGVGFTVYPMVSINLEYISDTYTKYSDSTSSGNNSPNITDAMYGLSISVPLTFF